MGFISPPGLTQSNADEDKLVGFHPPLIPDGDVDVGGTCCLRGFDVNGAVDGMDTAHRSAYTQLAPTGAGASISSRWRR